MARKVCLLILVGLCTVVACNRLVFNEQTKFSVGYSESKFQIVKPGMSVPNVLAVIGHPLQVTTQQWSEAWSYSPKSTGRASAPGIGTESYDLFGKFTRLHFTPDGVVEKSAGNYLDEKLTGLTKEQVVSSLGEPNERSVVPFAVIYHYTLPGESGTYRVRQVWFDSSNRVATIVMKMRYD